VVPDLRNVIAGPAISSFIFWSALSSFTARSASLFRSQVGTFNTAFDPLTRATSPLTACSRAITSPVRLLARGDLFDWEVLSGFDIKGAKNKSHVLSMESRFTQASITSRPGHLPIL